MINTITQICHEQEHTQTCTWLFTQYCVCRTLVMAPLLHDSTFTYFVEVLFSLMSNTMQHRQAHCSNRETFASCHCHMVSLEILGHTLSAMSRLLSEKSANSVRYCLCPPRQSWLSRQSLHPEPASYRPGKLKLFRRIEACAMLRYWLKKYKFTTDDVNLQRRQRGHYSFTFAWCMVYMI